MGFSVFGATLAFATLLEDVFEIAFFDLMGAASTIKPLLNGAGLESFEAATGAAVTAIGLEVAFASFADFAGAALDLLGTPTSDAICPSYW
jgi:hypothetical protein